MIVVGAALLGLLLGSFINVVVVRLQAQESLGGRSRCRSCGALVRWYHNVPLLSFAWLRGCCATCHAPISWQYPAVETASALLFGLGAAVIPAGEWFTLGTYLVVATFALALWVFDWQYGVLPDSLTLSGAALVLILNLARGEEYRGLILGLVVAAGWFAVQYVVSRGRWIGSGDIRLGLFMGAALGWPGTAFALIAAYWVGALVGLSLVLVGKKKLGSELPFGTFLTAATVAGFLWGEVVSAWYFSWLGF